MLLRSDVLKEFNLLLLNWRLAILLQKAFKIGSLKLKIEIKNLINRISHNL